MKRTITALSMLLLSAGAVSAQTGTAAMSATIPSVMYINVTGSYGFPVLAAAWDAGIVAGEIAATSAASVTHRANVNYKITIQATGANLGFVEASPADAGYLKPSTDFQISPDGVAAYVGAPAPASPANLLTRNRGGTVTSATAAKLLVTAADPPGVYSTTITFTIAAN